jgi:hypothetical protein
MLEDRGPVLLATKALKLSDIVFVEKALCTVQCDEAVAPIMLDLADEYTTSGSQDLCVRSIIDKLMWSPELAAKFLPLLDRLVYGSSEQTPVVDGRITVDTFLVRSMMRNSDSLKDKGLESFNAAREKRGSSQLGPTTGVAGFWLHAAHTAHSREENSCRALIGDVMIVHAVRPTPLGEEIIMDYLGLGRTPTCDRNF